MRDRQYPPGVIWEPEKLHDENPHIKDSKAKQVLPKAEKRSIKKKKDKGRT